MTDLVKNFISSLITFITTSSWFLVPISCRISFKIFLSSPTICKPSRALTAKELGVSKTMLSLSLTPEPWSYLQLRASDLPIVLPGQWCMAKSNLDSSRDQQACPWSNFLAVMKYSRFLWSVQILTWCSTPSTKCLHSSKALTIGEKLTAPGSHACLAVFLTNCTGLSTNCDMFYALHLSSLTFSARAQCWPSHGKCVTISICQVIWLKHADLLTVWHQAWKIPQYDVTFWIHDCQRFWEYSKLWIGRFEMFLIMPRFDAFGIIFFNIPGDVNY